MVFIQKYYIYVAKIWLNMEAKDTQVYRYDFTAYYEDIPSMIEFLKLHCTKWMFQQEKCPSTGKLHLQGRISLKTKVTLKSAIKLFSTGVDFNKPHLSKTSKNCVDDNYVCKEETRVAGPWSNKDKTLYMPIQFRIVNNGLLPWQQSILDNVTDPRKINIIIDKTGNIGKTTFVGWLACQNKAENIPFCNDFRDIMRMVMDKPTSKLYFIDMPRAIKKERLAQLYAGIEVIKGGYCYDDRHSFREKYIDSPEIWVFTNFEPDYDYLSEDRWVQWAVFENNLIPYSELEEKTLLAESKKLI